MKIRYGLCILFLFVGLYVLICVSLQLVLWREELHSDEEVCAVYCSVGYGLKADSGCAHLRMLQ